MGLKAPVSGRPGWTFLSNHGHVLLAIARNPDVTLREVAALVGITERTVQRIVADLEAGQYLERARTGRRNRYEVHPELPLRHPMAAHRDIGSLIELVTDPCARNGEPASLSPIATATMEQFYAAAEARQASRDSILETGSRDGS
jgi:DNA-binding IclR family transcriptional regulator